MRLPSSFHCLGLLKVLLRITVDKLIFFLWRTNCISRMVWGIFSCSVGFQKGQLNLLRSSQTPQKNTLTKWQIFGVVAAQNLGAGILHIHTKGRDYNFSYFSVELVFSPHLCSSFRYPSCLLVGTSGSGLFSTRTAAL